MERISLGICAMEKKVNSKHMQSILQEIFKFKEFEIIYFTNNIIFDKKIEEWPVVQVLIIFFSNGFPFNKGLEYINLRKPLLINDFDKQKYFWDRRKVFEILSKNNIPTPKHVLIDRGEIINNDISNGEKQKLKDTDEEIDNMIKRYTHNQSMRRSFPYLLGSNESLSSSNLNYEFKEPDELSIFPQAEIKRCENELHYQEVIHYDTNNNRIIEYDDHLEFYDKDNLSIKLNKPFVEKPCNGDDHRIFIYYPPILGGGIKRLFRKTKNLSSLYIPNENYIRKDKSYIYEEFLQTDGFDIKVYTVGPEYAHAEARKSPSLDGVVRRTIDGKEVRYPINLTPFEKNIAKKIVEVFGQNVCGFDILRSQGKSYVCDVNGWSFVKSNKQYSIDCAILIRKMILDVLAPFRYESIAFPINIPTYNNMKLRSILKSSQQNKEELRSIVCVFRHADRSPKQKMKLLVTHKLILNLFNILGDMNSSIKKLEKDEKDQQMNKPICYSNYVKEIKLKKPKELDYMLKLSNLIIQEKNDELNISHKKDYFYDKMIQLKMILETNKNFMGMTRKIQIKPLKVVKTVCEFTNKVKLEVKEALFIFKWGGDITHSGLSQAKMLGTTFRLQVYPGDGGEEHGILRLHSTYRHDLKVYSSDEGRCMKTGAAFLQGLLQLDGSIIPIIFSMIRKDDAVLNILDDSNQEVTKYKKQIKKDLSEMLHFNGSLLDKFKEYILNCDEGSKKEKEEEKGEKEINIKEEIKIKDILQNKLKIDETVNFKQPHPVRKSSSRNNSLESLTGKEIGINYDKYLFKIMERIENPLIEMKTMNILIEKYLNDIKFYLNKEELKDTQTYYITNAKILSKRKVSVNDSEKILILNDNNVNTITSIDNKRSKSESNKGIDIKDINLYNDLNLKLDKQHSTNDIEYIMYDRKDKSNKRNENIPQKDQEEEKPNSHYKKYDKSDSNEFSECESEKVILIYKRWIKIYQDFYDRKKKKFDISKIPDIYDNIKYDLIHNTFLKNDNAKMLFNKSLYLSEFLMPQEYGITLNSKIKIGMMIIKPLLNKICNDLLWWIDRNDDDLNISGFEKENDNFSGLDANKLKNNEIKSLWRHLKTRFYFTSASHLYSLINVICYGLDSNLLEKNEESFISELKKNRLELDYCSHLMFRLYENFNVKINEPERFRLEVIMSPGANKSPYEADENHMVSVSPWIVLNKNLTLQQLMNFFDGLTKDNKE